MRPVLKLIIFTMSILTADANLRIEIRQGMIKKTPIAIAAIPGETTFDKKMQKVLSNDLKTSGLFKLIDEKAFIQSAGSLIEQIRFGDWKILKAQFLVTIDVKREIFGKLAVTFKLYDIMQGRKILSETLKGDPERWRRIAHVIADKVFHRITGEDGCFSSRIAYVQESGPRGKHRKYRLAVMDSDGYNNQFLTSAKYNCMMPRFSRDGKKLTYVQFHKNKAQVYMFDMVSGERRLLGRFKGFSFSSRFSPDAQHIVMSVCDGTSSYIVLMDTITGETKNLTQKIKKRIDVSPCFSLDGKQIYFTSDRHGQENIYVMNKDGTNVRHINIKGGKYSQPVVSPRGDKLAFTKQVGNRFNIGVMNLDGTNEYSIHQSNKLQEPAWASNGRYISFTKQGKGTKGKTKLMMIDITGRNLTKLPTDGEASASSWSPPADANK